MAVTMATMIAAGVFDEPTASIPPSGPRKNNDGEGCLYIIISVFVTVVMVALIYILFKQLT